MMHTFGCGCAMLHSWVAALTSADLTACGTATNVQADAARRAVSACSLLTSCGGLAVLRAERRAHRHGTILPSYRRGFREAKWGSAEVFHIAAETETSGTGATALTL